MTGGGRCLNWDSIPVFAWSGSVRIPSVQVHMILLTDPLILDALPSNINKWKVCKTGWTECHNCLAVLRPRVGILGGKVAVSYGKPDGHIWGPVWCSEEDWPLSKRVTDLIPCPYQNRRTNIWIINFVYFFFFFSFFFYFSSSSSFLFFFFSSSSSFPSSSSSFSYFSSSCSFSSSFLPHLPLIPLLLILPLPLLLFMFLPFLLVLPLPLLPLIPRVLFSSSCSSSSTPYSSSSSLPSQMTLQPNADFLLLMDFPQSPPSFTPLASFQSCFH